MAASAAAAAANAASSSSGGSGTAGGGARKQLLKKMEERNVSISNAKDRWNFLKKQSWKAKEDDGAEGDEGNDSSPPAKPQSKRAMLPLK